MVPENIEKKTTSMRKDIRWLKDCSVDEGGVQLFAYMKEKSVILMMMKK